MSFCIKGYGKSSIRTGLSESVFCERGLHHELLTDNATASHSRDFLAFAEVWDVCDFDVCMSRQEME